MLALLKEVSTSPPGMYKTKDRIKGLLTVVSEVNNVVVVIAVCLLFVCLLQELPNAPLYYVLDSVCSTLHCDTPKMLAIRFYNSEFMYVTLTVISSQVSHLGSELPRLIITRKP